MTTLEQAARARAAAHTRSADKPSQRRMGAKATQGRGSAPARFEVRAGGSTGDGSRGVFGCASVVERGYEMYDMFGPYTEVVSRSAFDNTLATDPLVEFTLNHNRGGGLPMASTRNGTLTLAMSADGLDYDATVDPSRSDVADMLKALERGDLAEASFKFRITRGQWSPDYTEYRIEEVDLDRGDVSAVNFGANPLATSFARAANDEADGSMLTQAMAWFTALDSIVDEAQEALAAYLGVPSPDPDEAQEAAQSAVFKIVGERGPELPLIPNGAVIKRQIRSSVTDDDTRHRSA